MKKLAEIISSFIDFINGVLVPLVFAIALIVFLFGVFRFFIAGADNPEKRKNGTSLILYSIIGFAIMVSVWGLVNLVVGTFGFDNTSRPCLPTFGKDANGSNCGGTTSGGKDPVNLLPPGYSNQPTPVDNSGEPTEGDSGLPGIH
jgi:hypothetical protein